MQGMMCTDEMDSLDSNLFHMLDDQSYQIDSQRNTQSVAIVECGKRLLLAAKDGDVEFVRHLISKGAPFTTDWLGVSPLHLAAQNNHTAIADVLLRAGISRDARTKVERTPLHLAAQEGHIEMVQLLISQGADVNCRDMLRMTPLHWAVEREHLDVIEALLKAGSDPYAVSKFGKTPVSMAQDMVRPDLVHVLKTTESCPVITLQQSEELQQTTLEATEQIAADLNMADDITHHLAVGPKRQRVRFQMQPKAATVTTRPASKAAAQAESAASQINAPTVSTNEANNTLQLLQAHGITMLPTDKTTIVESAMESGQTVVLTEAGKMALSLTGVGGRIVGQKGNATIRTITKTKASPALNLAATLSGSVQRRAPAVLGNQSRIIKIHPKQLVALGGGRVSVQMPSFKVDQLLLQQGKLPNIVKKVVPGKLQRVILASPQPAKPKPGQEQEQELSEEESSDVELESRVVDSMETNTGDAVTNTGDISQQTSDPALSSDIARIAQELAEARKQAAEFREQLAKKEREAELYLKQLQNLQSAAK